MQLTEAMEKVLALAEANLEGSIDMPELARAVGYSDFYLQRVFAMMAGEPLGTYLRERRLTCAGRRLQAGERVLDTALRYGWESPESFEKAFKRFHGVTAKQAKQGAPLRCVDPLHIRVTLTGGRDMDYQVENMDTLYVMGKVRRFDYEDCFQRIPEFWTAYYREGYHKEVPGFLGVCLDDECGERKGFAYMIGCFCGVEDEVCEGFEKRKLDAGTWAKFKAHGAMPDALQKLNRQIFTQWLPSSAEWTMARNVNLEVYTEGDMSSADYVSEIWIPVKPKA